MGGFWGVECVVIILHHSLYILVLVINREFGLVLSNL